MSETMALSAVDQKRLDTIGVEIKAIHRQAVNQTIIAGIEIGRRLEEAKELAGHGNWGRWLEENVGYSQSQATNFMNLYKEYGSGQIGLFGDTLPDNIKGLGITKALALLDVPVEEREEFVEAVHAEDISTRELKAKVQEYKKLSEDAIKQAQDAQKECKEAQDIATEAIDKTMEYKAQVIDLEKQLRELESRPVEVAVEAPSEEMLAQIREEAAAKYQAEREKIQKKLEQAEKKLADAETKAAQADQRAAQEAETAKAQVVQLTAEAKRKAEEAEARAEAAEKKLKSADTDTAQFKLYMEAVQENWNKAMGVMLKADEEKATKFKAFCGMLIKQMEGRIK